jgi:site-specific DNA-adenine methylase
VQVVGEENTPPECREFFNRCQEEVFHPDYEIGEYPNYEAAVKYVYVLTQIFSGSKPETSNYTDYKGKYRCKVLIFMDKLKNGKFREHFDKITFVENMDFQDVIEKYDSPTSYFYTDPPYWKTENYYSNHDFDRSDHERLADCLKNSEGRYSLSYYDFPLLQTWFPYTEYKWEQKGFKKSAAAKKDGTQNTGIEILIMNYGQPSYKEGEQLSMFELVDDEKDKTKKILVPKL